MRCCFGYIERNVSQHKQGGKRHDKVFVQNYLDLFNLNPQKNFRGLITIVQQKTLA